MLNISAECYWAATQSPLRSSLWCGRYTCAAGRGKCADLDSRDCTGCVQDGQLDLRHCHRGLCGDGGRRVRSQQCERGPAKPAGPPFLASTHFHPSALFEQSRAVHRFHRSLMKAFSPFQHHRPAPSGRPNPGEPARTQAFSADPLAFPSVVFPRSSRRARRAMFLACGYERIPSLSGRMLLRHPCLCLSVQ